MLNAGIVRGRRWWLFFFIGAMTSIGLAVVFGLIIAKLYSAPSISQGRDMPQGNPDPVVSPLGTDEFYAEFETSYGPMGAYMVAVEVGTGHPSVIPILLDTGSSDTWFDKSQGLASSTTFKENRSQSYSINYMGGSVNGNIGSDTITFGKYHWSQNFGVVQSNNIGLSGIIGLARGCGSSYGICVLSNWKMKESVISFYYDRTSWDGRMTAGYINEDKYCANSSKLTYIPQIGNYFWTGSVDLSFGSTTLGSGLTGVFDTGTTYFMMSQSLYQRTMQLASVTGACKSPTISLTISGTIFVIPTSVLLISNSSGCSMRIDQFNQASFPFDMIVGAAFLVNFYTVMDLANNRMGFCPSAPGLGGGRRLEDEESAEAISKLLDAPERRRRWH